MLRLRMSAISCSARRSCCHGPHSVIMVVYVLLSHRPCSAWPSGRLRTQSNSCHALKTDVQDKSVQDREGTSIRRLLIP